MKEICVVLLFSDRFCPDVGAQMLLLLGVS